MTLAIVSAMPDELAALQAGLATDRTEVIASRKVHRGRLAGREVLLVLAGIGKVAAATTAAVLVDRFNVDALLFTGVAGGLGAGVSVGDVVVGALHSCSTTWTRRRCFRAGKCQAPAARALWQIRGLGRQCWRVLLRRGAGVAAPGPAAASVLKAPQVHTGLIVSGDRFVSSEVECQAAARADLPDALAVEMEGAAVAQVCHDFGRPFGVLRTISDRADDQAHVDFPRFLAQVAAEYSRDIVLAALLAR